MKTRNTILCCILILIFTFIIPIQTSAYDYNDNDVIIDFLPGDIDNNKKVTSADARLCLRAAANLETLTDKQIKSVDFDGTGKINSANARSILRAAAKLETLSYTVILKPGQNLVIGPLTAPTGWEWQFTSTAHNKFNILVSEHHTEDDSVGSAPDKSVIISSYEIGKYTFTFNQIMGWNQKLYKTFNIEIFISD